MNYLIIILVVCFFIFLYVVYVLSKEDFVILRHNTPMEKIFNAAFLAGVSGLFFARLVYVFTNPDPIFHSLLGFILFPYFPGLSLMGGILGGFLFSFLYFKSRLLQRERLMDFFSMAFIAAFPVGLIGTLILSSQNPSLYFYLSIILSFVYLFIIVKYVLLATLESKFKDGTLSLIFLSSFSIIYILIKVLLSEIRFIFDAENALAIVFFITSLAVLLRNENFIKIVIERWKSLR